MIVWVDGSLLDDPEAPAIRVDDHGLTVGDGVFEALKVVAGVPFALTRHLLRLCRSAAALGLPAPDANVVRRAVDEVLSAAPLERGRLRITYTGGQAPLGSGRGEGPGTLVVAAAPMDEVDPVTAIATVPWPRNERGAMAGVKSTSYAENVIALAEAHRQGAGEAIFANLVGNLCEGTGSNIGYVLDGEARTPSLASGCLAGITRELLLEWVEVREIDEPIEVLREAEEIFVLSTTRDVQAVRTCDGRALEAPGPVTRELARIWGEKEKESADP